MDDRRLQRFTRRWFAEWSPDQPVFGRATRLLRLAIEHGPSDAWQRILALVRDAPSDDALACVAAGPLEDFLCDHGAAFIERLEAEAARDDRFAACLRGVWGWTRIDPAVYSRVRQAARPSPNWPTDAELQELRRGGRRPRERPPP